MSTDFSHDGTADAMYACIECGHYVASPRKARITQERWEKSATLWCPECESYETFDHRYFDTVDDGDVKGDED